MITREGFLPGTTTLAFHTETKFNNTVHEDRMGLDLMWVQAMSGMQPLDC